MINKFNQINLDDLNEYFIVEFNPSKYVNINYPESWIYDLTYKDMRSIKYRENEYIMKSFIYNLNNGHFVIF